MAGLGSFAAVVVAAYTAELFELLWCRLGKEPTPDERRRQRLEQLIREDDHLTEREVLLDQIESELDRSASLLRDRLTT
jgi:hypothetical protein